jgi:hypothetical protein
VREVEGKRERKKGKVCRGEERLAIQCVVSYSRNNTNDLGSLIPAHVRLLHSPREERERVKVL